MISDRQRFTVIVLNADAALRTRSDGVPVPLLQWLDEPEPSSGEPTSLGFRVRGHGSRCPVISLEKPNSRGALSGRERAEVQRIDHEGFTRCGG
jgi:hypothetical protein